MKKNKTCLFSSENGQNVTITPEKQIEIEEDFDSTRKCGSASDSSAVSLLFINMNSKFYTGSGSKMEK